jgi:hypothetical protein
MRYTIALLPFAASLVFVGSAAGQPPVLSSVVVSADRHISARFSAPLADEITVYVASKPDLQAGGGFVAKNIVEQDALTTDVIQSRSWTDIYQLDPGTYFVMLSAVPDFNYCYDPATGTYDPSCADGFSNVAELTVPVPRIQYAGHVRLVRHAKKARLRLTATPLGTAERYRVCYVSRLKRRRCVSRTIRGYFWDTSGSDQVSVSTRSLRARATFTWYVGSQAVARRRVSVRHVAS